MSGGELDGRITLITGAASGLGAETAALLARRGAEVVYACDFRADALNETVDRLRDEGLAVEPLVVDVSDQDSWAAAIGHVEKDAGRLDTLLNNAGISGAATTEGQFGITYWNRLLAVNLTGPYLGILAAWPLLKKSESGAIVNTSSVAGIAGFKGLHPGYAASKGGLRTLTKSMAIEMASDGIRVNSVHPGAMPSMQGAAWEVDEETERATMQRWVPLGRKAAHSEVAEALVFLGSPRSSYITGVELYVDGGWLAQ